MDAAAPCQHGWKNHHRARRGRGGGRRSLQLRRAMLTASEWLRLLRLGLLAGLAYSTLSAWLKRAVRYSRTSVIVTRKPHLHEAALS
jgi:hypothetical protein